MVLIKSPNICYPLSYDTKGSTKTTLIQWQNTSMGSYVSLFPDLKLSVQTPWSIKPSRRTTRNAKGRKSRSVPSRRDKTWSSLILWYQDPDRDAPQSRWCDVKLSRERGEKPGRDINASECHGRPVWSIRVTRKLRTNVGWVSSWSGRRGRRRSVPCPPGACVTRESAGRGSGGPAGAPGPGITPRRPGSGPELIM